MHASRRHTGVIVADDLTGALDTAVPFAARGWHAEVIVGGREMATAATAADTATADTTATVDSAPSAVALISFARGLPPPEARRANRAVVDLVQGMTGPAWVYQKIDSTLRGAPGTLALDTMRQLRQSKLLLAPAFPELGRTTVDGIAYLDGERLGDLRELVRPSLHKETLIHLPLRLVRGNPKTLVRYLRSPGKAVFIADAETDSDLDALARWGLEAGITLFCGSAGLATGLRLARAHHVAATATHHPRPYQARRRLIVAASRQAAGRRQIAYCTMTGVPQVVLSSLASPTSEVAAATSRALQGSTSTLLTTPADDLGGGPEVAAALAEVVAAVAADGGIDALTLTGGEVARAVCQRLRVDRILLRGEVSPGLPWGLATTADAGTLLIATKAGNFGGDAALFRADQYLGGPPQATGP